MLCCWSGRPTSEGEPAVEEEAINSITGEDVSDVVVELHALTVLVHAGACGSAWRCGWGWVFRRRVVGGWGEWWWWWLSETEAGGENRCWCVQKHTLTMPWSVPERAGAWRPELRWLVRGCGGSDTVGSRCRRQ
ncbi:hypothetical protein Salat_2435400 [Sesamum alatum]|uniref:Uncharacterized protein n=1 Tax=Sesamum alatum TaxID=300844 RepID=A0AAE1XYZ2_9LAMI|nr:hypothetical protein Salat_2435400 [Sesamum alatum]